VAFLPLALLAAVLVLVLVTGIGTLSHGGGAHHAAAINRIATPAVARGSEPVTPTRHHRHTANAATRMLEDDLGETLITRLNGTTASPRLLARIRAHQLGGVILFSETFAAGAAQATRTIGQLQKVARAAGAWPLLIMTDQEGGEVRRLASAAPRLAPRQMTSTQVAHDEGLAAGKALRGVGVNVDLAPVADVEQITDSFLAERSFGSSAQLVAQRACAFAQGLSEAGVGYTLKHFPGLGTAPASTDVAPVVVPTAAGTLRANYAAYRRCGRGPRTLVMISSASYPRLPSSKTPALDAPEIYQKEMRLAGIEAPTISDDMQAGALAGLEHPALHALRAGLDLLLYAQSEQASSEAYEKLDTELHDGSLSAARVRQAATAITHLKAMLAE
jgi:beta-N-acetylhexosaminidase